MSADQSTSWSRLRQPVQGFRYGIDSLLLARFAKINPEDKVCDLGCGVGIIGQVLLTKKKAGQVVGLDIQKDLISLAEENAALLGVEARFQAIHASWQQVQEHFKPKSFQVVISNPPYYRPQHGLVPPQNSKAIAKHEISGTMEDLIAASAFLLKSSGRFYLMYPPLRLEELIAKLNAKGFKIQRMAMIHPYLDKPATLVMVECVKAMNRELILEAPVIVYRDPEHYTAEVEAWVGKKRRV